LLAIRKANVFERILFVERNRMNSATTNISECREDRLLDRAMLGNHRYKMCFVELFHVDEGSNALFRRLLQKIRDGAAFRGTARFGNFMYFQPIAPATIGEEHDIMMCRSDEHVLQEVILTRGRAGDALSAAPLTTIT